MIVINKVLPLERRKREGSIGGLGANKASGSGPCAWTYDKSQFHVSLYDRYPVIVTNEGWD